MDWLEITISTSAQGVNPIADLLTGEGVAGLVIEDEQDFKDFLDNNHKYWDYVDQQLYNEKAGLSCIKFYASCDSEGEKLVNHVRQVLQQAPRRLPGIELGSLEMTSQPLKSEDWESGYKQFYKPTPIGEKILILPVWEQQPETDRTILRLDPGISFGTGSHATTRLCLEFIEQLVLPGWDVLDIGCGSGILAIGALLLGANTALGCDIDHLASEIAASNAAENGLTAPRCSFMHGDVLSDKKLCDKFEQQGFDLVAANIVADVIIPLSGFVRRFMRPGGYFICSGIIENRRQDVAQALEKNGFEILQCRMDDDWCAFLCK